MNKYMRVVCTPEKKFPQQTRGPRTATFSPPHSNQYILVIVRIFAYNSVPFIVLGAAHELAFNARYIHTLSVIYIF